MDEKMLLPGPKRITRIVDDEVKRILEANVMPHNTVAELIETARFMIDNRTFCFIDKDTNPFAQLARLNHLLLHAIDVMIDQLVNASNNLLKLAERHKL